MRSKEKYYPFHLKQHPNIITHLLSRDSVFRLARVSLELTRARRSATMRRSHVIESIEACTPSSKRMKDGWQIHSFPLPVNEKSKGIVQHGLQKRVVIFSQQREDRTGHSCGSSTKGRLSECCISESNILIITAPVTMSDSRRHGLTALCTLSTGNNSSLIKGMKEKKITSYNLYYFNCEHKPLGVFPIVIV